jgi:hypothetical protein
MISVGADFEGRSRVCAAHMAVVWAGRSERAGPTELCDFSVCGRYAIKADCVGNLREIAVSQPQKIALAVYLGLLTLCVALMITSEFLGPTAREAILPISVESFKMVLAALVGAISALLGVKDVKSP